MPPANRRQTRPSLYARIIAEATSCPSEDLQEIEEIMREDIFHSTLDWQSRNELMEGARLAYTVLQRTRGTNVQSRLVREPTFLQVRFALSKAESEALGAGIWAVPDTVGGLRLLRLEWIPRSGFSLVLGGSRRAVRQAARLARIPERMIKATVRANA